MLMVVGVVMAGCRAQAPLADLKLEEKAQPGVGWRVASGGKSDAEPVGWLEQFDDEGMRRAVGEAVTLELALAEDLPWCRVDASQLEAAILNLAINARDAMPHGGEVRLVTRTAWLSADSFRVVRPLMLCAIKTRSTRSPSDGVRRWIRPSAVRPVTIWCSMPALWSRQSPWAWKVKAWMACRTAGSRRVAVSPRRLM
jgi:hypothetical protein